jgi:hypothetical protein
MKEDVVDLSVLEPDQFVEATKKPLAHRRLSRAETWMLATLRIYVLIAVPLVIYAFIHALVAAQ